MEHHCISNPLLKHAILITVTLPLNPCIGSNSIHVTLTLQRGQTQGLSALLVWRCGRNSNPTPVNRAPLHRARCVETVLTKTMTTDSYPDEHDFQPHDTTVAHLRQAVGSALPPTITPSTI
ncbi:hypothetical protein VN97_g11285 [Penicillium thymicola]|uniref:Uncharacterized protein n=1 Tax=Penicillium thymicola TaxID=293382 RepID=A0AAI9X313_PENTH|nr:hypothetical protein VN97_g11285 [Penicillium thymicola]